MNPDRDLVFDAGRTTWLWGADKNDRTHPTMSFTFDHEIDGKQLLAAWRNTMRVYPVLDCAADGDSKRLLFFKTDEESCAVHTASPVCPCTPLAANRPVSLSWDANKIHVVAYHSVMDGAGIVSVIKTLIYEYCCLHFGKRFDGTGIMLKTGREPIEYYQTKNSAKLGDYTAVPLVVQPDNEAVFIDPDMKHPGEGVVITAQVSMPPDQFLAACKACGANPSVMLCVLFGRAAYAINENDRRRMAFALTLDQRKMLGLTDTLGQCSSSALLSASYAALMEDAPQKTAARLRAELNAQRTEDYVKTYVWMERTYEMFFKDISAVISYEGRLNFGECGRHITGMSMVNNTANTLHMVELNGSFLLTFQFGGATQRYMEAFLKELARIGVCAKTVFDAKVAETEIGREEA